MEGLAALSLIANTFQVIDFSYQILKTAWEAYKTGTLSSNVSQEQVALDLRTANDFLQAKLTTNARQTVSKDDQATLDLASKATAVADELLQHLKKSTSPQSHGLSKAYATPSRLHGLERRSVVWRKISRLYGMKLNTGLLSL